jgi:hypothetical protein
MTKLYLKINIKLNDKKLKWNDWSRQMKSCKACSVITVTESTQNLLVNEQVLQPKTK